MLSTRTSKFIKTQKTSKVTIIQHVYMYTCKKKTRVVKKTKYNDNMQCFIEQFMVRIFIKDKTTNVKL